MNDEEVIDDVKENNNRVQDRLTNVSKNIRVINHITVGVGDTYKLLAKDKKDKMLMQKIDRAVELGVLKRG